MKWSPSPKQSDALAKIARWLEDDDAPQVFRLAGPAGCLGIGTPVLMFDGSVRRVEDLVVGDRLMGPDSQPRTIQQLCRGQDEMFKIEPTKGASWICNAHHVMTLAGSSHVFGKTIDIELHEILAKTPAKKSADYLWKLWRVGVNFWQPPDALPIDPYLIGLWLGDGTKGEPRITNCEPEILEFCQEIANRMELTLHVQELPKRHTRLLSFRQRAGKRKPHANCFTSYVLSCVNARGEKMIPQRYLVATREERLALLAGLLDTDGYLASGYYDYITESSALRDGILFLARSLGFAAYSALAKKTIKSTGFSGTYHRISISGELRSIPCRVPRRQATARLQIKRTSVTGWTATAQGIGDFYGFALDGDGRFLLGDFTVTHNSGKSSLASTAVASVKGKVLFAAPTGKAALVMRRKGCKEARTIHSLAYLPAGEPMSKGMIEKMREECRKLYALNEPTARASADRLVEQIKRAEEDLRQGSGPRFSLKLDSEIRDAEVLVVDEASMVSDSMGVDLVSFGTKILAIYDPYQLPPVRGLGYFSQGQPDALLDEIHRQALGSPILRLADLARRGERLPIGRIDDDVEVRVWTKKPDPSLEARAMKAEMILVGRNATRRGCNARIRQLLGREGKVPVPGDRVLCKRNDRVLGLLNGSIWTVRSCIDHGDMTANIEVESMDDGSVVECTTWLHHFFDREDELGDMKRRQYQEFTWGWAITAHVAQGSQSDDVLVFDESQQFGKDASKHLYTSITRASKRLCVAVPQ